MASSFGCEAFGLFPDSWHGKVAPVLDEWFSVVIRNLVDITHDSTSNGGWQQMRRSDIL